MFHGFRFFIVAAAMDAEKKHNSSAVEFDVLLVTIYLFLWFLFPEFTNQQQSRGCRVEPQGKFRNEVSALESRLSLRTHNGFERGAWFNYQNNKYTPKSSSKLL